MWKEGKIWCELSSATTKCLHCTMDFRINFMILIAFRWLCVYVCKFEKIIENDCKLSNIILNIIIEYNV